MKNLKQKMKTLTTAVVPATLFAAAAITVPMVLTLGKKEPEIQSEYFEIVDGELKGFKSDLTEEQKKEACKGGVLKLPAVETIAADAFNAEMLRDAPFGTTIEIQKSTTKIGERAFYANTASAVTFAGEGDDKLVEIDDSAFAFCTNLTSFKFPSSMFTATSIIQDSAFFGCSALNTFDCTAFAGASTLTPSWAFGAFKGTSATGYVLFNGSEATEVATRSNFAFLWSRLVYSGVNPAWVECWNNTTTPWTSQIKSVPTEYLKIVSGELQGSNEKIWPTGDTNFNTIITTSTVTSLSATINADLFAKRPNVTTWNFSNSTFTVIPASAFANLSTTTVNLYLPSTITTINDNAFNACKWNINFSSYANITSIGASAFSSSSITKFEFPTTLASVGNSAFASCASLKEIDLSAWSAAPAWTGTGIFTSTGSSASASEYKIKIKTISGNVIDQWELKELHKTYLNGQGITIDQTTGNTWTFDPTASLQYSQIFDIQDGVLKGWAKNSASTELTKAQVTTIFSEYNFGTTLTIPDTVTSIDTNAFYASSASKLPDSITKIVIDSECTTIGANAFSGAVNVTEVKIPAKATSVANSAFSGCTALATIDLSGWTAVPTWTGTGIFTGCAAAGTVNIQTIENQIDQWRFNNSLRTLLKEKGGITTWSSTAWKFDHEDTATLLKVDSGVVTGWSSGATEALTDDEKVALATEKHGSAKIVVPAAATSIADDAFVKNTTTSTIPTTLPTVEFEASSSCISIGNKAFYAAPITTLNLANATSLTTIGNHAFSGSKIVNLTLTSSLTSVGMAAFYQTDIQSLTIPVFTNPISFGAGAFANNASLNSFDLSAYDSLPTWTDSTNSLFDNISTSGTIKVKTALQTTILAYMSQHSNSIAYYDEWTVTTA